MLLNTGVPHPFGKPKSMVKGQGAMGECRAFETAGDGTGEHKSVWRYRDSVLPVTLRATRDGKRIERKKYSPATGNREVVYAPDCHDVGRGAQKSGTNPSGSPSAGNRETPAAGTVSSADRALVPSVPPFESAADL